MAAEKEPITNADDSAMADEVEAFGRAVSGMDPVEQATADDADQKADTTAAEDAPADVDLEQQDTTDQGGKGQADDGDGKQDASGDDALPGDELVVGKIGDRTITVGDLRKDEALRRQIGTRAEQTRHWQEEVERTRGLEARLKALEEGKAKARPAEQPPTYDPVKRKAWAEGLSQRMEPLLKREAEAGALEPEFSDLYPLAASRMALLEMMVQSAGPLLNQVNDFFQVLGEQATATTTEGMLTDRLGALARTHGADPAAAAGDAFRDWLYADETDDAVFGLKARFVHKWGDTEVAQIPDDALGPVFLAFAKAKGITLTPQKAKEIKRGLTAGAMAAGETGGGGGRPAGGGDFTPGDGSAADLEAFGRAVGNRW